MRSIVQSVSLNKWELPEDPYFIIAGPCSVESRKQILLIAKSLAPERISFLRAGAWKPRTLSGLFEGFGEEALDWLVEARELYKIEVGTEVGLPKHVEACLKRNIQIVWIGTRTTPNTFAVQELANALKGTNMCVLVKNPICPDIKLWIGAIERIYRSDIKKLAAIHRGFSTPYKSKYRYPALWRLIEDFRKCLPNIPLICDPSHICGDSALIDHVIHNAIKNQKIHYDGFMIEVHNNPKLAMTDNGQQITPIEFHRVLGKLKKYKGDNNINEITK